MKWIGGNMKRWNRSIAFHYLKVFLLVAAVTGFSAGGALAAIFTGSSGNLSASAVFEVLLDTNLEPTLLKVTLTNTSSFDVLVPADVLTAVFFSLSDNSTLTRESALLAAGSSVFYDTDGQPAGGVVGGEWAYASGLSGAPYGATQGISSTGVGLFGPGDRFPGADLQPPASPDGLQYGILSAGDNTGTGNGGITGSGGLIKNAVVFTLSGLPAGFDPSTWISKVSFQYGTSLSEPNIPYNPPPPGTPVPEPASLLLFGSGLVAFAGWGRKHLNSKKASD
jgi:hypothetical protein